MRFPYSEIHRHYRPNSTVTVLIQPHIRMGSSLSRLIFMEHQRPHFNTLPRLPISGLGIDEGCVGDPPGPAIQLGVKTLDQQHLFRCLAIEVMPFVLLVWADGQGLTSAIGVDEPYWNQVGIRYGAGFGNGERVLVDGLDGPPDVDDLVPSLEESVGVVGKVVWHAILGRRIRLIDVYPVDGAAEDAASSRDTIVLASTTDGVVEDEDAGCTRCFLQQSLSLGIVFGLDLFVVKKIRLGTLKPIELKAILIKCIFVLGAPHVVDSHVQWSNGAFIRLRASNIGGFGLAAITRIEVIIQCCGDVMRFGGLWGGGEGSGGDGFKSG